MLCFLSKDISEGLMSVRGKLLAFVVTSFITTNVQAAENADNLELSPEQLFNATVISASKTPEKLMDAPAAVYVLTNEDIMRSGATSVPEALRQVPGIQVARINANNWAISVRGFAGSLSNKLLVLIDGRQVYDPLFSGVYWDIQDMVLEDIEHIEVVRGPGATLWGDNAVDGVINIITKKAQDTQGNLVSLTVGNQDRAITEERYGGKLGENGYYRVYGKYFHRDNEKTLSDTDAHDAQTQGRGGFRADWKDHDSSKDDFTVQGDMYRNGDGDLTSLPLLVSPYAQIQAEDITARGGNILGRWNRIFSDDSHFTLQSYVDYTSREQLLLDAKRTSFDVDAQYELPSYGRHKIVVGSEYHYTSDNLSGTQDVIFQPASLATSLLSGFAQDKITLQKDKWYLTLGSKFSHNDYTGFEVQPNARLQWHPTSQQMIWASAAYAIRTPSRVERDLTINAGTFPPSFMPPFPTSIILQANPDYGDEHLTAYELGYRNQLSSSLSLDVATFYNMYDRLETSQVLPTFFVPAGVAPAHNVLPFIVTNDMSGNTYGVETVVDWQALDNLKFSASYSLLEMQLYAPSVLGVDQAQSTAGQSPENQFNVRVSWDVKKDISFDTALYYISALPALSVDDYWRLDMRWNWRIMDGLQFSLVGQDLLAPSHREFSSPTAVNAAYINPAVYGNITWRY